MSYLNVLEDTKQYVSSDEENEVFINISKPSKYSIVQKSSLHNMLKFFDEKWRTIKSNDINHPRSKVNLNIIKKDNKINKGMFSFHRHSKLMRRDGKIVKKKNDDFKDDEKINKINKPRKTKSKHKKNNHLITINEISNENTVDEIVLNDSMINEYRTEFFSDLKKLCDDDKNNDLCPTPIKNDNNMCKEETLENRNNNDINEDNKVTRILELINVEIRDILNITNESIKFCGKIDKSNTENTNVISTLEGSLNSIIRTTDNSVVKGKNTDRVMKLW